jgi:hypothetical protein
LGGDALYAGREPLLIPHHGRYPRGTGLELPESRVVWQFGDWRRRSRVTVELAPGDSFGATLWPLADWRPYHALLVTLDNPMPHALELELVLRDARGTDHASQVLWPLRLPPGRHELRCALGPLRQLNRQRPEWSAIRQWQLTAPSGGQFVLHDVALARGPRHDLGPPPPPILPRPYGEPLPPVTAPLPGHDPQADAVLSRLPLLPPGHPLREEVTAWPRHPRHDALMANLDPGGRLTLNHDMACILVPPDQPLVPLVLDPGYQAESDPGPFPIPDDTPLEGWPRAFQQPDTPLPALGDVQRDPERYPGDRHAIVLDPQRRRLYEFFHFVRRADGWHALQASVFDLATFRLRPDGWTSADAAGLPIFPLVVRYDELAYGLVDHPLRVTFRRTRRAYLYPARHYASRETDPDLPRMGERLRLRADFDITGFSPPAQAILRGAQCYGLVVADNGADWTISATPDPRFPDLAHELQYVPATAFEWLLPPGTEP